MGWHGLATWAPTTEVRGDFRQNLQGLQCPVTAPGAAAADPGQQAARTCTLLERIRGAAEDEYIRIHSRLQTLLAGAFPGFTLN